MQKGFSLVELLVVVSIIAIMSVGAVVGFGRFGDVVQTRQGVSAIHDLIKQSEYKILTNGAQKITIRFLEDYLVIDEKSQGATLSLVWESGCSNDLRAKNSGNLFKRDGEGNIIATTPITSGSCANGGDFKNSPEREWVYQLTSGSQFSNKIRLVHFNVNRDNDSNPLKIRSADKNSTITIEAPYAKKTYTNGAGIVQSSLTIRILEPNDTVNGEDLTLP